MKIMVNGIECDDLVLRKERNIISIYELLGLIKDSKAPKKIKYDGKIYIFYDFVHGYYEEGFAGIYYKKFLTFKNEQFYKVLNDEVEILDKEDEFIDIEEFSISYSLDYIDYKNIDVLKNHLNKDFQTIFDTFDILIKNQKKIINKLKEEGK